jgi:hypothetical protein
MRPWMLKGLQRERRKIERERAQRQEQRLALVEPDHRASHQWREQDNDQATSQQSIVRRGVWVTEL